MQKNYTEKELRTTIIKQKVEDKIYYYSIGKKEQKSISFFSNDRLLVFDFDEGKLFYLNEVIKLPFHIIVPKPKAEFTFMNTTTVIHHPNTTLIEFNFFYNNQQISWKFTFQTPDLAEEWIKLFQFQRQSKLTQDKDFNAVNKSIIEMPKLQKQTVKDIVKEPERDIPNDQSRLLSQMIGMNLQQSRAKTELLKQNPPLLPISPINASRNKQRGSFIDWNLKFYQNRDIQTLYEFKKVAIDVFFSSFKQDNPKKGSLRVYDNEYCTVKIANKFTAEAKKLKNEYRNYHFILQATNKSFIIGVPLVCIVEYECVVGQVKARFPEGAETLPFNGIHKESFNQLQRYTRIKNRILENTLILNLSSSYDPRVPSLIYLGELVTYLPINTEFPKEETLLRPEYMLDHIDYFIYSSDPQKLGKVQTRQLRELSFKMMEKVKKFSTTFYLQSFPVCTIGDLKTIIHEAGFNLKFLPHMYHICQNYQIKQYLYTAMTAKVVKDYIFQTICRIKANDERPVFEPIIEESLSLLLAGNNNKSNELWKEIALLFKKKYNLVLNHKDILPGFFFNSIIELIPGSYEISKINKQRKIFQETQIIQAGFFGLLQPKVKCFDRFMPEDIEQLKNRSRANKKSKEVSQGIRRKLFNDKDHKYEVYFQFGNNDEWMTEYLSLYYPPQTLASDNDTRINFLFDRINEEPPTYFSLTLTRNYLEWCNKKQNTEEFKKVFQKAMSISDYWLDENHPIRSDLLEVLSDYYSILGANEDMIKFMKDSLTIASKFWGSNSQTGMKQYELADRYLRGGRKRQALQMFTKAKQNLEHNKAETSKLGLTYMKLSSIFLSDLQYEKCIQYAKRSIEVFQDYQKKINSLGIYNEPYKIKAYQILARVYQICDQRTDYKELALSCSRKFNLTKNKDVYEQMVRICLASVIFKSTKERCESFQKLARNLDETTRENSSNQRLTPIEALMKMSEDIIVMEKFIYKFQFMERSLTELGNRKKIHLNDENKQFLHILENVIAIVGIDYIGGLVEEKTNYVS